MQTRNTLADSTLPELLDIISYQSDGADAAMYFLLHHRLVDKLRKRYETYRFRLRDSFDDIVEDFFLYLRGEGSREKTYQSLRLIRNKDAGSSPSLSTFSSSAGEGGTTFEGMSLSDERFDRLYPTLFTYYIVSIDSLPEADAVRQLRRRYHDAGGDMLHEPDTAYSLSPSVNTFWKILTRIELRSQFQENL